MSTSWLQSSVYLLYCLDRWWNACTNMHTWWEEFEYSSFLTIKRFNPSVKLGVAVKSSSATRNLVGNQNERMKKVTNQPSRPGTMWKNSCPVTCCCSCHRVESNSFRLMVHYVCFYFSTRNNSKRETIYGQDGTCYLLNWLITGTEVYGHWNHSGTQYSAAQLTSLDLLSKRWTMRNSLSSNCYRQQLVNWLR